MKGQCGDLRNTMMRRRRFIRPSGGRRIADRISGSAEGVYSGANQISSREDATNFGVRFIACADVIFVMEWRHRDKIRKQSRAGLGQRPVYVLGIPDEYERDQPELIALLKEKVPPLLHREC